MSDVSLTLQNAAGVYLAITETPSVVTLSQAVISGALASTVTVSNVVSVSVVTMPSITVTPAAVTTVSGTVTIGSLPAISGTVTANTRSNGISNDPWICIPNLTMSHPDVGNIDLSGYYRFNGENGWGPPGINASFAVLSRVDNRQSNDQWEFSLIYIDDNNDQTIQLAGISSVSPDFPTTMYADAGTLVSGSLTFTTQQRETYGVSVNNLVGISGTVTVGNSVTIGSCVTHGVTIANSSVTIAGTVTANLSTVPTHAVTLASTTVTVSSLPALAAGTAQIGSVTASISGTVPVSGTFWQATQPISGTVTVSSTTVTVSALPSGALTTRFGSVTTANTAQLTTAVTNSSRKYLLCQNLDPSVTVTIGIGFTPTTTQGIQLAAGGGIIMDSFVSTGAVWWLSSSAGSNFNILEG